MNLSKVLRLACAATLLTSMSTTYADSFASSASSAGSASSGSISNSLSNSSDSSSDNKKVATGDYRIIDVAEVPDNAALHRLTLQADESPRSFALDLPAEIVDAQRLKRGDLVHVQDRVYGLEFAHSDTREAFYLVLADEWHDELAARPLTGL